MKYTLCTICKEAYFRNDESMLRHQQMCLALKSFFTCRPKSTTTADVSDEENIKNKKQAMKRRETTALSDRLAPVKKKYKKEGISAKSKVGRESDPSTLATPVTAAGQSTHSSESTSVAGEADPVITSAGASSSHQSSTPQLRWRIKKGLSSARDFIISNPDAHYRDSKLFLAATLPVVEEILQDELQSTGMLKYNIVLEAYYNHPEGTVEEFNFKVATRTLFKNSDGIRENLAEDGAKILAEESEFQSKGSGWSLDHPSSITLRVSRFNFNRGTGKSFIDLPKRLKTRKATVNIRNTDDKCFKYCLLVKFLENVDSNTVLDETSFAGMDEVYNFNGIKFPVSVNEIAKFERLNPDSSVNVFESGPSCDITPLRVVDEKADHTDLLLYKNASGHSHYVYIIDFAKLIRPQIASGTNKIAVCKRCSTYKEVRRCKPDAKTWLDDHLSLCSKFKPTNIRLPVEGKNILKFEEYETEIPVPIVVVADFESTLEPSAGTDRSYQYHEANSFCTLVQSTLPHDLLQQVGISTQPYLHRSRNAGREFMLHLRDLASKVEILYTRQEPMLPLTDEETERFVRAMECELCKKPFNDLSIVKVRDHCHLSGKLRYILCSKCNLRCQTPNFIPVYLHNMSRYDGVFILKNLGAVAGCQVKVIPATNDKFIAISVRVGKIWLRFLDSYRLMASGLAELADTMLDDEFVESRKLVPSEHFNLIRRKGVYPYDYVTSDSVFDETKLPPQSAFYNRLNDEACSDADYQFAEDVWNKLNFKTFSDYHSYYLKLDCCLLFDCLAVFRKICIDAYKIDCCHMYTAPGLAYKAMLRMTQVSLELLTDADQMLFIEGAIRGGLVQCALRYARANNPHLSNPLDYNKEEKTSYLWFLDCINLYGFSQSSPLPNGNFRFVDSPENVDWSNLPTDSPIGYILECDVEVPIDVHDKLKDLPPLPELKVPPNSEFKCKKLLATLENKEKYVAHYTVFQQALRLGLRVGKPHRALSFSQSRYIKPFVDFNAKMRAESVSEHYKRTYKAILNANYGRLLMSKRNQRDVRIVTTDRELQKLIRQPRFVEHVIIADNVVAVHLRRKSVLMNAPIYAGMAVLDVSKVHMYSFFYDVLCKHLKTEDCSMQLCYADTDSCLMYIHTERDFFQLLKQPSIAQYLDLSVYPTEHPLYSTINKSKIGCFKDEAKNGLQLMEYVGLRAKMYAYRYSSEEDDAKLTTMKAKGIKSTYVKRKLRFETYKNTLFSGVEAEKAEFNLIQNRHFRLTSKTIVKKSLTSNDDKRQILDCGIQTLPYGHFSLANDDNGDSDNTVEDSDIHYQQ